MTIRRLLDAHGRTYREFTVDESDGRIGVNVVQDCEPIIEDNKRRYNDPVLRRDGQFFYPIAEIPKVLIDKWSIELGVNIWKLPTKAQMAIYRQKLNDPDYRYLKRTPLRV